MKNYTLPLFLHANPPIGIYVIADKIFLCERWYTLDFNPRRAFQLLQKFNENEQMRKVIPEQFHKYLLPQEIRIKCLYYCIAGFIYGGWCYCLLLNMTINEDDNQPVVFKDFATAIGYSEDDFYIDPLPVGEVKVKAKEAFHLLANICTSAIYEAVESAYYNIYGKKRTVFNSQELKEAIKEYYHEESDKWEYRQLITMFAVEYISYVREWIEKDNNAIQTILRLSGARIIAFLADQQPVKEMIQTLLKEINRETIQLWEPHQQIINYTLLRMIKRDSLQLIPEYKELFHEKWKYIEELGEKLHKDLPVPKGKIKVKDMSEYLKE